MPWLASHAATAHPARWRPAPLTNYCDAPFDQMKGLTSVGLRSPVAPCGVFSVSSAPSVTVKASSLEFTHPVTPDQEVNRDTGDERAVGCQDEGG